MKNRNLFCDKDACQYLDTYQIVWNTIVDEHHIPYEVVGGRRIYTRAALDSARVHVERWRNRRRITRRPQTATS